MRQRHRTTSCDVAAWAVRRHEDRAARQDQRVQPDQRGQQALQGQGGGGQPDQRDQPAQQAPQGRGGLGQPDQRDRQAQRGPRAQLDQDGGQPVHRHRCHVIHG